MRTQQQVLDTLVPLGCAVGPLETIPSVFENPQVVHRKSFVTVEDPVFGPMRMMRPIPNFLRSQDATISPGPSELGADTEDLLRHDLKLDDSQVAQLREEGVIPSTPLSPEPQEQATFA